MKSKTLITIIIISISSFLIGCVDSDKKSEIQANDLDKAKDELIVAEENYTAEVLKFKNQSNEKIAENEKLIAEIKPMLVNKNKTVKAEKEGIEDKIGILEQKNNELKSKLNEYQDKGEEQWKTLKEEFSHDVDELGKSLKNFRVDNKK